MQPATKADIVGLERRLERASNEIIVRLALFMTGIAVTLYLLLR